MSGLLGAFGSAAEIADPPVLAAMAAAMRGRGTELQDPVRGHTRLLAAVQHEWELGPALGDATALADEDDLTVAADATLYYHDDLLRALESRGVRTRGTGAASLILAAYRAWGERCIEHLEGDFAFVLHDRGTGTVFCGRDFVGNRPLFYAPVGESLLVASSLSSLLRHPQCSGELNLVAVAEAAAGLYGADQDTAYRAIRSLPAGRSLSWAGGAPRVSGAWEPPHPPRSRAPLSEAAEELRELLGAAVRERLAPAGQKTAVWLSGGYDSTAVYGAGAKALGDQGRLPDLEAVSMSYPPGDSGREDELIEQVVAHWNTSVRWVDINNVPVYDRAEQRAGDRDDPYMHAFEMWNRSLARESVAAGARVAWTGLGGDALFQVSPIYFADLFRGGRWLSTWREWRGSGFRGSGFRSFFGWAIQPSLPPVALRAAAVLRCGRPLRGYIERTPPEWIDHAFVRRHRLVARERNATPPRRNRTHADRELIWYLSHPYAARVYSTLAGLALEEGVEVRSPLMDRRIIRFALSRPRTDRRSGGETKRALRNAVRGWVPEAVLAPRTRKTGTTATYFDRMTRQVHAELLSSAFAAPVLAELGIVDAKVLRERSAEYLRTGRMELGLPLFLTLQTELWLRSQAGKTIP